MFIKRYSLVPKGSSLIQQPDLSKFFKIDPELANSVISLARKIDKTNENYESTLAYSNLERECHKLLLAPLREYYACVALSHDGDKSIVYSILKETVINTAIKSTQKKPIDRLPGVKKLLEAVGIISKPFDEIRESILTGFSNFVYSKPLFDALREPNLPVV